MCSLDTGLEVIVTKSKLIWKKGDGWIEYDPPRCHPSYDEWMKLKEKERQDEHEAEDRRP